MIKKTGFFCIAILAMSCMFFAGQSWAQCSGPADSDGDGITDDLDPCDNDITNECFFETPDACETFIGAHPVVPGQSICGPAHNELCVVEYKFCANGTANKKWDPDPKTGMPGATDAQGTWTQVGRTLTIDTTDPTVLGMAMRTLETYDTAYVYYEGGKTKLDLNSAAKLTAGNAGNYARHNNTHVWMGAAPSYFMELNVDTDTAMTETAGLTWSSTLTSNLIFCSFPAQPNFCAGFAPPPVTTTNPPPAPAVLKTPGALYVSQVATTLVLVRQ